MKTRTYQIKEVATLACVSARTLRHYDEIGLLVPSNRSIAGYRQYTDADLLRLQQILIGRSLGLALEDIRKSIDDPLLNRKKLLQQQREALVARGQAITDMIRSIDAAISLLDPQQPKEIQAVNMKEIFGGFNPEDYEEEVQQRWGQSDEYKESSRRTRNYAADDWQRIKNESNEITNDAIALLQGNAKPDEPLALDVAERYRLWIDRWFYPCGIGMHANLADMYQGDARYAKYFDDKAPGLAQFIAAAIRANSQQRSSIQS